MLIWIQQKKHMFYMKIKRIFLTNASTFVFLLLFVLSCSCSRIIANDSDGIKKGWKRQIAKKKIALKCVHLQLQTLTINDDFTEGGVFFSTFFFVFAIIGMFITFEWTFSYCSYIVAHYQYSDRLCLCV